MKPGFMKFLLAGHLLIAALLASNVASSQELLKLNYKCKAPEMAFSKVTVLDKRVPGQMLGYVQKGGFNRLVSIDFQGSLADSLALFFQLPGAKTKSDKEIVFVLEELFLVEETAAMSESGRMKSSVRLFVQDNRDRFKEVLTRDSTVIVSGWDVTKGMLASVSTYFCGLAGQLGHAQPMSDRAYSLAEISTIDSVELLQLPLSQNKPVAGIYRSYASLRNNVPDRATNIGFERLPAGDFSVFEMNTNSGRTKKSYLQRNSAAYAVSDGERVFRFFDGSWYQLESTSSYFYFDAFAKYSNNGAMWGAAIGGIAGAAIGSAISDKSRELYRFRINPRTGKAAPIMQLQKGN